MLLDHYIVTSFPEEMSAIYKAAFEEKYPSVKIEILNKKTTAGLKFIEKNQVDLFWDSALDAFEVLKKKNLLQVYRPQEENIPKRISGYPVNEPNGFIQNLLWRDMALCGIKTI